MATDKCYANYKHNTDKKYEKACLKVFKKFIILINQIKLKNLESPIKLMGFKRLTNYTKWKKYYHYRALDFWGNPHIWVSKTIEII